ncbi:MAG: hypothetical protein H6661_00510 [Ardenticatenaceae bacterium]|nr:hypothetical protein [Ardenticatenaceae bacterium]
METDLLVLLVTDLAQELGGGRYGNYVPGCWRACCCCKIGQAVIGIWQFGLLAMAPEHFPGLGRFTGQRAPFEQPDRHGGVYRFIGAAGRRYLLGGRGGLAAARGQFRCQALPRIGTAVVDWRCSRDNGIGAGIFLEPGCVAGDLPQERQVLLCFLAAPPRWGTAVLLGGGLLFLLGLQLNLIPPSVTDRLVGFGQDLQFGDVRGVDINDANYAVLERLAHWQAALDMAREHLWWGVGFGNYEPAYASYALVN